MIGENMYVKELLYYHDVYLVFDRYKDYSIKSSTRNSRAKNLAKRHKKAEYFEFPKVSQVA